MEEMIANFNKQITFWGTEIGVSCNCPFPAIAPLQYIIVGVKLLYHFILQSGRVSIG